MQRYPFILMLLPLMVAILLTYDNTHTISSLPSEKHAYMVRVIEPAIPKKKTRQYSVEIIKSDTSVAFTHARAYLYKEIDEFSPGDTLWLRTRWQQRGRIIMGLVGAQECRLVGHGDIPWYDMRMMRHRLMKKYRQLGIDGQELQTISALVLGYKDEMDQELRLNFQRAGAAHVLAVSGLHTGIFYMLIIHLLTLFGRRKPLLHERGKRIALSGTVIVLIWAYAMLTGLSPSVMRSAIMLTLVELGYLVRRQSVSLNTLLVAAFIILLIRPEDLWSVGFWMSFAAVASLMTLSVPTHSRLGGLLSASVAAQIATLPIALYCFGQASNYFLLTNLLAVPLAGYILCMGLGTLVLSPIPGVNVLMAMGTKWGAWLMNHYVAWIEGLPGAVAEVSISRNMMFLLYLMISIAAILSVRIKNKQYQD